MMDVVGVGESMALLSAPDIGRLRDMATLRLSVAGAESNVAIGVSRLGHRAAWIGRVGADELGQKILAELRREGVDVSAAIEDPDASTGLMFKERRIADVVRVTYYRKGFAGSRLCSPDLDEEMLANARILHVTGITLGLSLSARAAVYRAVDIARSNGALVSFDFNYRSALWPPEEAAKEIRAMALQADLVFAGEDELAMVADDDERRGDGQAGVAIAVATGLAEGGAREVVIKRGRAGAIALVTDGTYEEPALPVHAVDPVGAGDAFVAGYLAAIIEGRDSRSKLRQGCATGAFAVASLGDWEGLPSREDLTMLDHAAGTTLR